MLGHDNLEHRMGIPASAPLGETIEQVVEQGDPAPVSHPVSRAAAKPGQRIAYLDDRSLALL